MFSEIVYSNVFVNFFISLILLFSVLFGFGLIKYLYIKLSFSSLVIRSFGLIGVPTHELSHLIMCVIFGHKITGFNLYNFQLNGTLGYVHHSYNPKSYWHQIGRFFIGLAPLFFGALSMVFLTKLFLYRGDELIQQLYLYSVPLSIKQAHKIEIAGTVQYIFSLCSEILLWELKNNLGFFSLYSVLAASVGLFLCPSKKDLHNAFFSGIVIFCLSVSVSFIIGKLDVYLIFLSSILIWTSSILFSALFATVGLFLFMLLIRIFVRD